MLNFRSNLIEEIVDLMEGALLRRGMECDGFGGWRVDGAIHECRRRMSDIFNLE